MSQTLLQPEIQDPTTGSRRWMLTIFNNDTTTMDEVVFVLMKATGCTAEEAAIEMWEAHHFGKAPVHFASKEICEDAAKIIGTVGVKTEVALEWND